MVPIERSLSLERLHGHAPTAETFLTLNASQLLPNCSPTATGIRSTPGDIADLAHESQTIRVHNAPPKSSACGRSLPAGVTSLSYAVLPHCAFSVSHAIGQLRLQQFLFRVNRDSER